MADLVFIADDNNRGGTLVNSINDHSPAAPPEYVRGDDNSTRIFLGVKGQPGVYHANSGLAGVGVKLALVKPGEQVTGGTYKLSHSGNETAALDYNASAATIESALDGLASVAGVTVSGSSPCYEIEWDAVGAQTDFSSPAADLALTPDGAVNISVVREGDGSTKEKVMLELYRQAKEEQGTWATITDPAAGWEADFPIKDRKICESLGSNAKITDLLLELQITDTSGKVNTPAQVPCVVRQDGIKNLLPASEDPAQYDDRTAADARYLLEANNLSDLANASTARTNLGISGANTPYSPGTPGDWGTPPTEVKGALDELAASSSSGNKTTRTSKAPSATGSENYTPSTTAAVETLLITPATGGGDYTYDYHIQRPTFSEPAPLLVVQINMPANNEPTIRIYDEGPTSSGADDILLGTYIGTVRGARKHFLLLVWDGGNSAYSVLYDRNAETTGWYADYLDAGAMIPRASNGPTEANWESTASDKTNYLAWGCAGNADSYVQAVSATPGGWDESTVLAQFVWTSVVTGANGDVVFAGQAKCTANNTDLYAAWGTLVQVTDTLLTVNNEHHSPFLSIQPANASGNAGKPVRWQFLREGTDVADDLEDATPDPAEARLLGVRLLYRLTEQTEDQSARSDP